jgi:RNA recognition motif-containing protein
MEGLGVSYDDQQPGEGEEERFDENQLEDSFEDFQGREHQQDNGGNLGALQESYQANSGSVSTDESHSIARDVDPSAFKLFLGGVSHQTTESTIRTHFGQYGFVVDAVLMTDKLSGHSRGFGFVSLDSEQGTTDCASPCLPVRYGAVFKR